MRSMAFAAMALLASCTIKRAEPLRTGAATADLETEIRGELDRYYADFSARKWDRFADHFWPGATLTTVWRPPGASAPLVDSQSVPSFVAKAPSGPDSKPIFEERLVSVDLRITRNLAQAWARYEARFGDSTDVATWRGIDGITLMKHAGRWRITSLAYTDLDGEITDRGSAQR